MQNHRLNRNSLHLTRMEEHTFPIGLSSGKKSSMATAITLESSAVAAKCYWLLLTQRGKMNFTFYMVRFFVL